MSDDTKYKAVIAAATALAAGAEGLRQYAYYDPPGVLTVCYGHTGKDVVTGKYYDVETCRALLDKDMAQAVATVDRCAPDLMPGPRIAFADAVYNLGPKIICDRTASTAAHLLARGDVVGACEQLPRWDKAKVLGVWVALPGLTARRARERDICLGRDTPVAPATDAGASDATAAGVPNGVQSSRR